MMDIDAKIKEYSKKSTIELKAIFLDRTYRIIQLLNTVGLGDDIAKVMLTLFCAASRSDGKMSTTEYELINEALHFNMSYNELNGVMNLISSSLDSEEVAQQTAQTFGNIDDDYREYIVDYCLAICAIDGNIDRVEKKFLESLIGHSIRIGITVKVGTPYWSNT